MIEALTIENLKEYGFSENDIETIGKSGTTFFQLFINDDAFIVDVIKQEILSGTHAWAKVHFKSGALTFPVEDLDLAPDYYKKSLELYLIQQKKIAKSLFRESVNKERFKDLEITKTENILKDLERYPSHIKYFIKSKIAYEHYLIWLVNMDETDVRMVDPLALIDPDMKSLFSEVEKKARGETGKFSSRIRCAAFCELLYIKKYILASTQKRVTLNQFSKSRYGIDISNALETSKNKHRENHVNRTVKGEIPLKNCF